jgi:photosystem II stability/assembly factor-like uncharacterized protein
VKLRVVASLLLAPVAVAGAAASATVARESLRPVDVTVPDVLGLPAIKAAYRIDFAHLKPVCHDIHRLGTVVEQRPTAGAHVARGSVVTIFSGDDDCPTVKLRPIATSTSTTTTIPPATTPTITVAGAPGLNPIPPSATLHTITVAFVNLTIGYVLASATSGKACEIAVEKTTDGGATLGAAVPVAPCSEFTQGLTGSVRLAVDDHGDAFVFGRALYATHDGGSTWQAVPEPGQVLDVEAVGSSVWMFVGQCKTPSCWIVLMESTDGGESWHQSPAEPPILATTTDPQLVRMSTVSAYVLTAPRHNAFGEPDTVPIWSTTDGGHSGVQHDLPCPINSGDVVMTVAPDGKLVAVCAAQPAAGSQPKSVVVSTNGGVTWSSVGPCTTAILKGECTANSLILGYLGTLVSTAPTVVYLTGPRSPLYMSTNGGETWTRVGGTPGNTALTFFNEEDGLVLSDTLPRTLSRTDDGGASWSKVTLNRAS